MKIDKQTIPQGHKKQDDENKMLYRYLQGQRGCQG